MSVRAMVSICCSPPDKCPAILCFSGASRGNIS